MMAPLVSIIVATYNGSGKIPYLLDALLKQTFKTFELVVVIDGSTDNTLEVVSSYSSRFDHFKVVTQPNQGRSRVRNRGVQEASGELLIFYDDDIIPFENSVEQHVLFHKERQGLLAACLAEEVSPKRTDIQNYKALLAAKWIEKYPEGITQLNFSNLFFSAANSSMRKDVFNSLHGFDATLTDAEDQELAYRALKQSVPVCFDKQNKAWHREFITCVSYIRRQRMYKKSHLQLAGMYPELQASLNKKKSRVKRGVYWLFSFPLLPYLIDRGYFKILPRPIRYKLYDVVIQALSYEYPGVAL